VHAPATGPSHEGPASNYLIWHEEMSSNDGDLFYLASRVEGPVADTSLSEVVCLVDDRSHTRRRAD